MVKRIALGCDEAGLPLLDLIRRYLAEQNIPVQDFGVHTPDPVDYPDVAADTRRFSAGAPRAVTVSADGTRVVFLRSVGPTDPVERLWVYDVPTGRCWHYFLSP